MQTSWGWVLSTAWNGRNSSHDCLYDNTSRSSVVMEYENNICIHSYSYVKKPSIQQSSTGNCLGKMVYATSTTWQRLLFYRANGHARSPSHYSNPDLVDICMLVFFSWYIEMQYRAGSTTKFAAKFSLIRPGSNPPPLIQWLQSPFTHLQCKLAYWS